MSRRKSNGNLSDGKRRLWRIILSAGLIGSIGCAVGYPLAAPALIAAPAVVPFVVLCGMLIVAMTAVFILALTVRVRWERVYLFGMLCGFVCGAAALAVFLIAQESRDAGRGEQIVSGLGAVFALLYGWGAMKLYRSVI